MGFVITVGVFIIISNRAPFYEHLLLFDRIIYVAPGALIILLAFLYAGGVAFAVELFLLTVWKLTRTDNTSKGKEC